MLKLLLCLSSAAAFVPRPIRRRRGFVSFACEPSEGDVVVYRRAEGSELDIGVVVAEMSCTQWIHPLVAREAPATEVTLFEDEAVDAAIQVQGLCERVVDARPAQLPVPSLGGGVGYGSPAVDCFVVRSGDVADVDLKIVEQGMAPWTH